MKNGCFTFGSDPEMMLKEKNKYISAIGVIDGTRDKRKKIGKHQFYYDNVLAECAIAPGKTKDEVLHNVKECLGYLVNMVKPYLVVVQACQEYDKEQLLHPAAKEVGCSPERCAYSITTVFPPEVAIRESNLRTAGGHIHLGNRAAKGFYGSLFVVRMLDLFLGIPSIFLDRDKTSLSRRSLYGEAGRYRMKPYGCEYRVLGNFWLASPKTVSLIYDICQFVLSFVDEKKFLDFWSIDEEKLNDPEFFNNGGDPASCHICHGYNIDALRNIISTSDLKGASKFLQIVQDYVPLKLYEHLEKSMNNPTSFDLYKEWKL